MATKILKYRKIGAGLISKKFDLIQRQLRDIKNDVHLLRVGLRNRIEVPKDDFVPWMKLNFSEFDEKILDSIGAGQKSCPTVLDDLISEKKVRSKVKREIVWKRIKRMAKLTTEHFSEPIVRLNQTGYWYMTLPYRKILGYASPFEAE